MNAVVLVGILLLTGCAATPDLSGAAKGRAPQPSRGNDSTVPRTEERGVERAVPEAPATGRAQGGSAVEAAPKGKPPPAQSGAVVALLTDAGQHAQAGRLDNSAAALERALRIQPRDPVVWQRLAQVRMQQGRFAQAESLAAKSNSLAGSDRALRARNWRIIAEARQKQGDPHSAQVALTQAQAMEKEP